MFQNVNDPRVLVGLEDGDDAAVYAVNKSTAVIHTLDFFTPIVDNPYDYGAIAAANAMSDVYAMGGDVHVALNICGFPVSLGAEIMAEILRGGAEKVAEAGGVLLGGHTVDDSEPKYGLAVLGFVHPDRIVTKSGAAVGDSLYLSKPIGTGCITTALKNDKAKSHHVAAAVESMKMLNRGASNAMQAAEVTTATDITGFSLIGHAADMAEKSNVQLRFFIDDIPFLDGAEKNAELGMFPGGTTRNMKYFASMVAAENPLPEYIERLLYTPETSGGLLIAVGDDRKRLFMDACRKFAVTCNRIGIVEAGKGIHLS